MLSQQAAVKKALQNRSFKIFATRTRQEITKRENSSSKSTIYQKLNCSTAENFKLFFHTVHSNSVQKKSTYVKSQKIHVLDKWPTLTKIPHEHVPKLHVMTCDHM